MIKQTVLWTALPAGLENGLLRLSVFVSPRLETDENLPHPVLGQFPDFLKWPDTAQNLSFKVYTDSGAAIEVQPDLAEFDPGLWERLFTEETYVRPHEFADYSQRNIRSFPVRDTLAYLKALYQDLGERSPTSLPPFHMGQIDQGLSLLTNDLGGLLQGDFEKYDKYVDRHLLEMKALPPGRKLDAFSSQVEQDFFMAYRFYDRTESKEPHLPAPDPNQVPPPPKVPELDFHQALASLGDHPSLMRKLGIVLDLRFAPDELPLDAASTMIAVSPAWMGGFAPQPFHEDRSPWTRFQFDGESFLPAPRPGSDLQDGFLRLENVDDSLEEKDQLYDLIQVDPDGAAIKLIHFATTLRRTLYNLDSHRAAIDTPPDAGTPSLQSGGLALARWGRAERLHKHLQQAALRNSAAMAGYDTVLFADELLRGYRVDIRDDVSGSWQSLCFRTGTYAFPDFGGDPLPFEDEGAIKSASTTSKDDKNSDLYFHETLLRWSGWSLVAPRPERTIVRAQDPNTGEFSEQTGTVANAPETEFRIQIEPRATPGTLPRLRFGRSYQMRVRMADLAGNGPALASKDDSQATRPVIYLRYEPLSTPVIVPRLRFGEGESLERMVIRSNFDQTAVQYTTNPAVLAALQDKAHTYTPANERHIVPPKASQLTAELHGLFDPFFTPGQFEAGYRIAVKEEGTLRDTQVVDVTTGLPVPLPDPSVVEVVTPPDPGNLPPGETPPGEYILHKEEQILLPYLPDPLGEGAALQNLPGNRAGATPGLESLQDPGLNLDVLKVPFDQNWPEALPFRLRLVERPGEMKDEECAETFFDADNPPTWDAQDRLLTIFLPKADEVKIRYSTYPAKELDGARGLDLLGLWSWLRPSALADKLEFLAQQGAHWMISPYREITLVHAVQQPLCAPKIHTLSAPRGLNKTYTNLTGDFELSVKSTAKLDMTAEWDDRVDDLTEPIWKAVQGGSHAFEWRMEPHFPDQLKATLKHDLRHEFGDTRYRRVRYRLTGTTRFREYFPPEITGDPALITRTGLEVEIDVPNSARPAAPVSPYILPTFAWEEVTDTPEGEPWRALFRTRRGNGLRVYLERPWYSSGVGELLGLVLWPFPTINPGTYARLTSVMGKDPIHVTYPAHAALTLADFTNAAASQWGLSLEELPASIWGVAGFNVEYNPERRLWFADIKFNPQRLNSYYPFLRLALCRYQPISVPGAHLSRVLLSDFIQVAPDRQLALRFVDDQTLYVQVSGQARGNYPGNQVEVRLETHDPEIPGELGWSAAWPENADAQPHYLKPALLNLEQFRYRWDGIVPLPAARGSLPMRVSVREYEQYWGDNTRMRERRLVYADSVEL